MVNNGKLEKAIESGLDVLIDTLKSHNPTKEMLMQARLASSILSTGARYEATRNARLSIQIRVASLVLKDNKKRKEYLIAASPELKLLA